MKNAGDSPPLELEKEKFYLIGYTYPQESLYYAELGRAEENKGVSCSSNATDFHCLLRFSRFLKVNVYFLYVLE